MPPLSILLVVANDGPGGTQSQVKTQAKALSQRGHHVTVAVGGPVSTLADPAYDVVSLPHFRARAPWRFLRALRALRRRVRADVVHGHPLRLAPLVALSGAPRRLVTCHGIDPEHSPRWFLRVLRVLPVTVVACGEGPQRQLRSFGVRALLVDNALEVTSTRYTRAALNERFGLTDDAVVALWPARYSDQKGHDRLLEVVAAANEPRLVVICVGDGPIKDATEARRDALGLTSKVLVLDPLEDAASWLAATDFFIVPSRWEGQPLVVLEALAAGLPVASCCPVGLEGLIADGVNGTLVETPAELGRVLTQWVRDPSSRPVNPAYSAEVLARHQPAITALTLETLYGREN